MTVSDRTRVPRRLSRKAAASEAANRTLALYGEPLSDVRMPLADFSNSLLGSLKRHGWLKASAVRGRMRRHRRRISIQQYPLVRLCQDLLNQPSVEGVA